MSIDNFKQYFNKLRAEGVDIKKLLEKTIYNENPFYRYIGFKILEFHEGSFKATFPYKKELCRIGGGIHGGVIMTVIDHVAGMAALSINEGSDQVTVELKVNFIKPLVKEPFIAEGRVIRGGKRIIIAEGRIYDGDNDLCALGIGTWYIIK